jgi:hypothetical protein
MARLVRRCSVVSKVRSSGSDRHAASYELSSSAGAVASGGSAGSEGPGGRLLLLLLFPIAGSKGDTLKSGSKKDDFPPFGRMKTRNDVF